MDCEAIEFDYGEVSSLSEESPLILDSTKQKQISIEFSEINRRYQKLINQNLHNGERLFQSATSEPNYKKNRYSNVLAVERSRVKLQGYELHGLGTDYINANYINGEIPSSEKYYVCCQAPLQSTIVHFWLMIWEQKSYVILMLTRLMERGRVKASIYWPPNVGDTVYFDSFSIFHKASKDLSPVLTLRTFILRYKTEEREIVQFHYTEWPDFGIPNSTLTIRELAMRMDLYKSKGKTKNLDGPVVVHCSAGVGRAGTFVSFHISLEKIKHFRNLNAFDIPTTVLKLRQSRSGMVQTEEQYQFIYLAVRDSQIELLNSQKPVFALPKAQGTKRSSDGQVKNVCENMDEGHRCMCGETGTCENANRTLGANGYSMEKRRRLSFSCNP